MRHLRGMFLFALCFPLALQAGEPPAPVEAVLSLRQAVEKTFAAAQAGDETLAREAALGVGAAWEKVGPFAKRALRRRHPEIEEAIAALPEEAAAMARAAVVKAEPAPLPAKSAPPPEPAKAEKAEPAVAKPVRPAFATVEKQTQGLALVGACAVPTVEQPVEGEKYEKAVLLNDGDKRLLFLSDAVETERKIVVVGSGRKVEFAAAFHDTTTLTVVNPSAVAISVKSGDRTETLEAGAYRTMPAPETGATALTLSPAGKSALIVQGGSIENLVAAGVGAQPLFFRKGDPITVYMTDPAEPTAVSTQAEAGARSLVLLPGYPLGYLTEAVASPASVVYVGTPCVTTVACGAVPVTVDPATAGAYVIDTPYATVWKGPSGTTQIATPAGTATISHRGAGAAGTTAAGTSWMAHAGQTSLTTPAGLTATVTGGGVNFATRDEAGKITSVYHEGARVVTASDGRAAAVHTTAEAGGGEAKLHSEIETAAGGSYDVDAAASRNDKTASVTVTNEDTGESRTAAVGQGEGAAAEKTAPPAERAAAPAGASTEKAAPPAAAERAPKREAAGNETRRAPATESRTARKPAYKDDLDVFGDTGLGRGAGGGERKTGGTRGGGGKRR